MAEQKNMEHWNMFMETLITTPIGRIETKISIIKIIQNFVKMSLIILILKTINLPYFHFLLFLNTQVL